MEKHAKNVHQKLVPGSSFILVNTQSSHCTQEILLKIRYFERGLSKTLEKVNFIFSFEPSPFYWTELSKTKWAWK